MNMPDLRREFAGEQQANTTSPPWPHNAWPAEQQRRVHAFHHYEELRKRQQRQQQAHFLDWQQTQEKRLKILVKDAMTDVMATGAQDVAGSVSAGHDNIKHELEKTRDSLAPTLVSIHDSLKNHHDSVVEHQLQASRAWQAVNEEQQHVRRSLADLQTGMRQLQTDHNARLEELSAKMCHNEQEHRALLQPILNHVQMLVAQDERPNLEQQRVDNEQQRVDNEQLCRIASQQEQLCRIASQQEQLCRIASQQEQLLQLLVPREEDQGMTTRSRSRKCAGNQARSMPPALLAVVDAVIAGIMDELPALFQEKRPAKRGNPAEEPTRKRQRRC